SPLPSCRLPFFICHCQNCAAPALVNDKRKIEATRMRYREFKSALPLSKHVECIWLLESSDQQESTEPERILPDGCVELILNFGALFSEHKEAGHSDLQPSRFVVGQMTQPVHVSPTGPVQLLGIRFAPGGTLPFLPIPPGELTNRIAPLADIDGTLDR